MTMSREISDGREYLDDWTNIFSISRKISYALVLYVGRHSCMLKNNHELYLSNIV